MRQNFSSVGLGQENWALTLVQRGPGRNYGSSLKEEARVWSVDFARERRQEESFRDDQDTGAYLDRWEQDSAQCWGGGRPLRMVRERR